MAAITFYGAAGAVTGSKYLVEANGKHLLIDCGLFQGEKQLRERNWQPTPFNPRQLDAVLLTHAHIDHTGYLPRLVREGFHGPIYCTRGTAQLLQVLLPDSARLQEEDAAYHNRHNLSKHNPALPLYTVDDARDALELLRPLKPGHEFLEPVHGVRATFAPTGHLLGARSILLEIEHAGADGAERRVLFSGDLGQWDRPILPDPSPPAACDYLIVESTYGDRLHTQEDTKEALCQIVREAVEKGGPLLIPAFAIGRTQDLLYTLRELEDAGGIPTLPVIVDSPMASEATRIYSRLDEEHDEEYERLQKMHGSPLRTRSMTLAASREQSKEVNKVRGPRIIISAAGMMNGGRVLHHALRLLPDPNATLLFVGYQAAGTTGRRILEGEPEVKILKQWVPVRCQVKRIEGFSGHPDWKGILRWLEALPAPPKQTYLTHGEPEAAKAMAGHIQERFGWPTAIPQLGDRIELD